MTTLNTLFLEARTHNRWQDRPVAPELLQQLFDLTKMAPTSVNCQPARFVFVTSAEGKAKLKPFVAAGNLEKTMTAPVTVIVGHDYKFFEHLPTLFPHADARAWFVNNETLANATAARNGTLQAGYLILAARALGLDCGPMSGFDLEGVTQAFFGGTSIKADLLINLGYGDEASLHPRSPRPRFEDFCQVV
jgi:3-hydroxypropanoate dehydrogenase